MKNYYHILGLDINASKDEIKKAFRLHATKYHPDKQEGDKFFEQKFIEIKDAYDTLMDDNKRRSHDLSLKNSTHSNPFDKSSFTEKESQLRQKEAALKQKEEQLNKEREREALSLKKEQEQLEKKETELKQREDQLRKEKEVKKDLDWQKRENKIYFKTGNIFINGNAIKIGDKKYEIKKIDSATLIADTGKETRLLNSIFISKKNYKIKIIQGNFTLNVSVKSSFLNSDEKFARQIIEKLNQAINDYKLSENG